MKIVIIGNSVAGQTVAEELIRANIIKDGHEITNITKEPHPYYTRIFLPQYIAGKINIEKLYVRNFDWYSKNNINLMTGIKAEKLDLNKKLVHLKDIKEPISYDKLVLATGSNARKFPFENPNAKGVFTLRTIEDANEIIKYIKNNNVKNAVIIGGGLLGIELSYNLKDLNIEVTICEIENRILPRQLCEKSSKFLENYLKNQGIKLIFKKSVKKILTDNETNKINGIEFENGEILKTDIAFQQVGIIPNIELAKNSGIKTNKGIIVNEYLETSEKDIFAAGDCIEFNNQIWGIIPPSIEQAKIVANNILAKSKNEFKKYKPTIWQTKLKIAGIDVLSIGEIEPIDSANSEVIWKIDENLNNCRKIILERNKLVGAILIGSGIDSKYFINNMNKEISIQELKQKIFE